MKKITIVFTALMIFSVIGCTVSNDTPIKVTPPNIADDVTKPDDSTKSDADTTSQSSTSIERNFVVGDTIKVGDLEVTVNGTETSDGKDFFKPSDGNTFYLIDVAIANKGQKAESISSMLMFSLRDKDGFSQDMSFTAISAGQSGLDGTVLPGKVIRGDLGYEIPKDSSGYELQINLSVFGTSGIFSVTLDNVSDSPTNQDTLKSAKNGNELKIGSAYSTDSLEIVVNGVRSDEGKDFFKPEEGNSYLLVDVSVTNKSEEAVTVSSMLMFNIRDILGYSYPISIGAVSTGKGSLDGQVMPGKTLRGEIGYEVPADISGLELYINPSVFSASDVFVVDLD